MNDILNVHGEDEEPPDADTAALPPDANPLSTPSETIDQLGLELQIPFEDMGELPSEPGPLVLIEEAPVAPVLFGDESGIGLPPADFSVIPPGQPGSELPGTEPPPPPDGIGLPPADFSVIPPGQPGGPSEEPAPPPPPEGIGLPPADFSVIPPGQPGGPSEEPAPPPPVIGDLGEPIPDFIPTPPADAELPEPPPLPEGLVVHPVEDPSIVEDHPTAETPIDVPVPPTPQPTEGQVGDQPVSTPVSTPVNEPVSTPVSSPVTQPTTPVSTPVTPSINQPVATPVTQPVATPVTPNITVPTSGPIATPIDTSRVPQPPAPRPPSGPGPTTTDADRVPPVQPETTIPDGLPTIPDGGWPFRQDYSPDDRDALDRDVVRPADDIERRQDWSPDDRDNARDADRPASAPVPTRQDWSPDDRDSANRPIDVPDLPWSLPTIPELQIPDLGGPLDSPLDSPADSLHGDPVAELEWAQVQSENGYCVPVSVGMVISEITGNHHAELELVEKALELGVLYGEPGNWLGMTAEGAVALVESYGVEAAVEYGSVDTLRQYLDDGRNIILMVDADEIWYGDDDTNPIDAGMDHALVITAIDDAAGLVYLNDPGQPEGAGFELSITALNDAWTDGGHQMVVTEAVATPLGQARREEGAEAPAQAGFVLLPIVIAADVIRRVSPWARASGDVSGT